MTQPKPFTISVPDEELFWITERVRTTRVAPGKELLSDKAWSFGLPRDVALKVQQYWTTKYDWRAVEAKLNEEFKMFTLPIEENDEDLTIHFVHHRSEHEGAIPLLFLHGWPGNFLEVRNIIEKLTAPPNPGQQAYHVIAPSLPGYGFSSYPSRPFSPMNIASTMNKLMQSLGYKKYMVQGGDWGSSIARIMAIDSPDSCIAIHINMIVAFPPSTGPGTLNAHEQNMLARAGWWRESEFGYANIQGTKPQTIAYALTDSPFGMMCWIRDKLQHLVDEDYTWDEETVITWAMMYILNGTPGHAELYKWTQKSENQQEIIDRLYTKTIPKEVAFGASIFPKDCCYAPRSWAEKTVSANIVFWKEHEKGGHFAAEEKPDELVKDIDEFARAMDQGVLVRLREAGR